MGTGLSAVNASTASIDARKRGDGLRNVWSSRVKTTLKRRIAGSNAHRHPKRSLVTAQALSCQAAALTVESSTVVHAGHVTSSMIMQQTMRIEQRRTDVLMSLPDGSSDADVLLTIQSRQMPLFDIEGNPRGHNTLQPIRGRPWCEPFPCLAGLVRR